MVYKSELSFDYAIFIFIESIDFLKMIEYNITVKNYSGIESQDMNERYEL